MRLSALPTGVIDNDVIQVVVLIWRGQSRLIILRYRMKILSRLLSVLGQSRIYTPRVKLDFTYV